MNKEILNEVLGIHQETHENEEDYNCFHIIEDGDWISDGKYEHHTIIVSYKNKYFQIMESRSGSYWTDYDYNDPEVCEVTPKKKIVEITEWEFVK